MSHIVNAKQDPILYNLIQQVKQNRYPSVWTASSVVGLCAVLEYFIEHEPSHPSRALTCEKLKSFLKWYEGWWWVRSKPSFDEEPGCIERARRAIRNAMSLA